MEQKSCGFEEYRLQRKKSFDSEEDASAHFSPSLTDHEQQFHNQTPNILSGYRSINPQREYSPDQFQKLQFHCLSLEHELHELQMRERQWDRMRISLQQSEAEASRDAIKYRTLYQNQLNKRRSVKRELTNWVWEARRSLDLHK